MNPQTGAPPTLVLFDIDGTLVDTAGAGRRAIERAFHEVFEVDGIDRIAARVPFAGMTDWSIFDTVAREAAIATSVYQAQRDRVQKNYLEQLRGEMDRPDPRRRVLPGVRELLEVLDGTDAACSGLLTGNLREGARIKLEPFDLNRYFADGGFGSDAPDRRTVARVARDRMEKLHGLEFPADRVVVVGDTDQDIDCARANGFRVLAVATGWCSRESLERAAPDTLLDDLADPIRSLAGLGLG